MSTTAEVRSGVAAAVAAALPTVTVYPMPAGAMLESTAAVIGVPTNIRPGGAFGENSEEWPVAVAVSRSGADDPATFTALEALLDQIGAGLQDALDDVSRPWREADFTRADFSMITLPGGPRPGYLLTLTITR